jgi:hypothetical protein
MKSDLSGILVLVANINLKDYFGRRRRILLSGCQQLAHDGSIPELLIFFMPGDGAPIVIGEDLGLLFPNEVLTSVGIDPSTCPDCFNDCLTLWYVNFFWLKMKLWPKNLTS